MNSCIQIPDLLSRNISDSEDPGSGHDRVPRLGGHREDSPGNTGGHCSASLSWLYPPLGARPGPPQRAFQEAFRGSRPWSTSKQTWLCSMLDHETMETKETMEGNKTATPLRLSDFTGNSSNIPGAFQYLLLPRFRGPPPGSRRVRGGILQEIVLP